MILKKIFSIFFIIVFISLSTFILEVNASGSYQNDYVMLRDSDITSSSYWEDEEFVPSPPTPQLTDAYLSSGKAILKVKDGSYYDWRSCDVAQGLIMGGYDRPDFYIGTSELDRTVSDKYLEIYYNGGNGEKLESNRYYAEIKYKINWRYNNYTSVSVLAYSEGYPACSVGINLMFALQTKNLAYPYDEAWINYNASASPTTKRGLMLDLYFGFCEYKYNQWEATSLGFQKFFDIAKYDHDFHYGYQCSQLISTGTWHTVSVDIAPIINEALGYVDNHQKTTIERYLLRARLRGVQVYAEAIGAEHEVEVEYARLRAKIDDDFSDNTRSTTWESLNVNGGTVSEVNQRLEVTTPMDSSGQVISGYVKKDLIKLDSNVEYIGQDGFDKLIQVSMADHNSCEEMWLMLCTSKTTNSDPYSQSEWYRIGRLQIDASTYKAIVQRKKDGVVDTLMTYQWNNLGNGKLQIYIWYHGSRWFIQFNYNDNFFYCERYLLSTKNVYVYVFQSTCRDKGFYGTDSFDDFLLINPTTKNDLFDFYDTCVSTSSWTIEDDTFEVYGSAYFMGYEWAGSGDDLAVMRTNNSFSSNRYVCLQMKTSDDASRTQEGWAVSRIAVKWYNWNNQLIVMLHPDQSLTVCVRSGGNEHSYWISCSETWSSWEWFEITVYQDRVTVLVDGKAYVKDRQDSYYDDFDYRVGLVAYCCKGYFDNVYVNDAE